MDIIWCAVDKVIEVSNVNLNIFTNIVDQLMMSLLLFAVFNEQINCLKSLICILDLSLEFSNLNNYGWSFVVIHVVS